MKLYHAFVGLSVICLFSMGLASCSQPLSAPEASYRAQPQSASLGILLAVNNQSTAALSDIQINGDLTTIHLFAVAGQDLSATLGFAARSVTIDGVTCPIGSTAAVTLACGTKISVDWTNPGIIAIIDYGAQN